MIKGKKILVTGGTGSFGYHIVKRLIPLRPKEIRIVSRDEKKQYDMKNEFSSIKELSYFIANVKDRPRIKEIMNGINIVYHAAALKQVPNCESCPYEAVQTNILGAKNVVDCALEEGVEKLIAISTDKAVKPVNTMGMTKAIQEKIVIQANFSPANKKKTKLTCVRYGNVMNSRGSVIPFFRYLLKNNKQLTITHKDMTRFMLTLGDAIDLVFFATEHAVGGEIFVKKAPSTKILNLAKIMSKMQNKKLDYKIIGTFPGEKIHEILISEEEMARAEDKVDYYIIKSIKSSVNLKGPYSEYCSANEITTDNDIKSLLVKAEGEKRESVDSIFFK